VVFPDLGEVVASQTRTTTVLGGAEPPDPPKPLVRELTQGSEARSTRPHDPEADTPATRRTTRPRQNVNDVGRQVLPIAVPLFGAAFPRADAIKLSRTPDIFGTAKHRQPTALLNEVGLLTVAEPMPMFPPPVGLSTKLVAPFTVSLSTTSAV
jgi:hypothetical protein